MATFSQENSKAVNTMPFLSDDTDRKYRIWSAANQKCLVLREKEVTGAGGGDEDGTEAKGTSKSQLFISIVSTCTQLVTYLTIKFDRKMLGI